MKALDLKEECSICSFWTKDPNHDQFRCHCGDCPDLIREYQEWRKRLMDIILSIG